MKVIAKRKKGLGWLWGICSLVFALVFLICAICDTNPVAAIFSLPMTIMFGILFFNYQKTTEDVISVDEATGVIFLHCEQVTINASSLVDVSYFQSRYRGISFAWGTIKLETKDQKYSCGYIADVEKVSKELTRIMYLHKNK